ncbi:hypothetical protein NEOLEDRAFT_1138249 [Neolentinus lepideus HHB14362 ss-1]|uniref:Uncharacterized protein n=1 Tax=Neolentinus lepideus HHB14362 ss-1 TaxID=1314782 RepID=A0A165QEG5_9AGAM|nr:hypothetical protein NEOLEDRAFT_1138249 [Neolentinus lepideus HHB14362 ss-1]
MNLGDSREAGLFKGSDLQCVSLLYPFALSVSYLCFNLLHISIIPISDFDYS